MTASAGRQKTTRAVDGGAKGVDDAALAQLEHENMIVALSLVAHAVPNALVRRAGGVVLLATGLPIRLFNQILVTDGEVAPGALEDAVSIVRQRGDRFIVNLRSGLDDRFLPLMAELGLVAVAAEPWMPGMALLPIPTDNLPQPPADHEIRRVTDEAGVVDHIRTASAGFELPESILRATMSVDLLTRDEVALYVGYTDGEPVSTGFGVRTGRTIGVYNIATLPSARKRGYAAAMTARVGADGAAAGCDVAVLQASDMGYPIYERLGYRTVIDYVGYVDPASLAPAEPIPTGG